MMMQHQEEGCGNVSTTKLRGCSHFQFPFLAQPSTNACRYTYANHPHKMHVSDNLRNNYKYPAINLLDSGLRSSSLQGRKNVMKMLKQQLSERRNCTVERETVDFFDLVIDELNKPNPIMDESTVLDLLLTMLFASHETTSMVLTVILKYLTDNPKALQELTVSRLSYLICSHNYLIVSSSQGKYVSSEHTNVYIEFVFGCVMFSGGA